MAKGGGKSKGKHQKASKGGAGQVSGLSVSGPRPSKGILGGTGPGLGAPGIVAPGSATKFGYAIGGKQIQSGVQLQMAQQASLSTAQAYFALKASQLAAQAVIAAPQGSPQATQAIQAAEEANLKAAQAYFAAQPLSLKAAQAVIAAQQAIIIPNSALDLPPATTISTPVRLPHIPATMVAEEPDDLVYVFRPQLGTTSQIPLNYALIGGLALILLIR